MSGAPSVSRPRRWLGLLLCLLGVASVILSYGFLPLYAPLFGYEALTGGEWASELITNMQVSGASLTAILALGWVLLPPVAAAVVGVLGIARAISLRPPLALLYLIVCLLGAIALGLTLLATAYGLRPGVLGEIVGYALCFWGDSLMRGKQPARVSIWEQSA